MDSVELTGMIIKISDVGESDRRIVILTKERGKIAAFARGAKRPKSTLVSATRLFAFGTFTLIQGSNAYSLIKADIKNYFDAISKDMEAMCYGSYFCEFADYMTYENMESYEMLKLMYTTLRALTSEKIPNRLVRCIFELRCLVINGEYPQMFECVSCGSKDIHSISISRFGVLCNQCKNQSGDSTYVSGDAIYTLQFIISTEIEKLYTFSVTEEILEELTRIIKKIVIQIVHTNFNSLKILETITT